MDLYFPSERIAVPSGRQRHKRRVLQLRTTAQRIDITEFGGSTLSVAADAPRLARGFVDIFEGDRRLMHGLVYQIDERDGTRRYAFKSVSPHEVAPPADFVATASAVIGYLPAPADRR